MMLTEFCNNELVVGVLGGGGMWGIYGWVGGWVGWGWGGWVGGGGWGGMGERECAALWRYATHSLIFGALPHRTSNTVPWGPPNLKYGPMGHFFNISVSWQRLAGVYNVGQ